ncbi:dopamine beta-hydroxylase isoform X1 [Brienomyrus brachyistius]|uniref:dopamine beta-hydroxylase isoform X1 n=1 Tax=Brienomyrus brachyistius TaxID=42636 RepID=UPI0020B3226D|nr:dopamine beta-hydroxylase isoform X1 [Brienomyrus brachyistius]
MRLLNRDLNLQDVTVMYLTTVVTLVVILVASFQAGSAPGAALPYRVPLDPNGNLQLSWNINYTQQELYLKLRVSHLHYGVVLGMSDRGEIFNADLVVLWSDGERSYFGDAWSDGSGHVTLDSQQDYQLLEVQDTQDGFYLLFRRPFSTCDPRDYVIEEGTVHLIYGLLEEPLPALQKLNLSLIHPGVQRVLLLRPDSPTPPLPPDVRTLEILAPGVTIPEQETTYWCHIYQLPADMPKNHIVMYESVVTRGNEAIVHHMEVFECAPQLENIPQYSGSCDSKMKPRKLNYCRHVLAAWAMGAEAFYYPSDAGLSLGGPGSSRFLRLEVHYHNPLLTTGRQDWSGIRLYYTPTLRKYDAGIMELGLVYTPVMAIPPGMTDFQLTGYCTAKCTQTALPPRGINIFASQLHTHLAGYSVRTVLVRGGQEVEIVQEDKHFSTHYQIIRTLKKIVNVLPGDVLLTRCMYNTEERKRATVGGFGIMEEMCVNYVHYYPRTQLELCKSHVDPEYLQKYFSFINRFQGRETCSCGQADVTEQFTSLAWDNFSSQVLSSLYNTAPITMHCNQSTAELFPVSRGTKRPPLFICESSARACMPLASKGIISTSINKHGKHNFKSMHKQQNREVCFLKDLTATLLLMGLTKWTKTSRLYR